MAHALGPVLGAPAPSAGLVPPARGGKAAATEPALTLRYSRQIQYARWADLPGSPALPLFTRWDMADSCMLRRNGEYRQVIVAYALSSAALARVTMEQSLRYSSDGRRLTPSGPWAARSETTALSSLSLIPPATSRGWPTGGPSGSQRSELAQNPPVQGPMVQNPMAEGPLAVLPEPVRWLLLSTAPPEARAVLWPGVPAYEDVRALSISAGQVVAVTAVRDHNDDGTVGPWDITAWRAVPVPAGPRVLDQGVAT
jgi:hypothetical protein